MTPDQEQKRPGVPWFLIFVLLGSTTINYIDRMAISVLAPTLRDEFGMSNTAYAWVINAFHSATLFSTAWAAGSRIAGVFALP